MHCAHCQTAPKKETTKLPKGWHRDRTGNALCASCWGERYILRAVQIPVVRPLGATWEELRAALRECWSQSTALANWAVSHTFAQDVPREPGMTKCPPMPRIYLYPEATKAFPALPSQTVAAVLQSVQAKYHKRRYDVLWACEASLPNAQYPQPFASPNQSWTPAYVPAGEGANADKVPAVVVTLLRGQRFTLQLRGGRDFRRQLGDFAKLVSGEAIQGQIDILRRKENARSNHNGVSDRDSGGQKAFHRVIVKMVGWFPRREKQDVDGTLFVRTDRDALLVALDPDGERLWWMNADHVRRWTAEHRSRLQRWSEDQKAEQRPVASFQSRREAAVLKFRNRIQSAQQEACAQLAAFARRRRVAIVKYDDSERGYLDRFDWSGLKTRLEMKLDEYGIALEHASAEVVPMTPDVAREEDLL